MTQEELDKYFMKMALSEAQEAFDNDEVPIGAVVTCGNRVVGRGHNLTETLNDVTAHAEMQAITAAVNTLGGKYLQECTLYVTVEPCLMCAGAISWSQIKRIVFGAFDQKRGYSVITKKMPFHPRSTVTAGILGEECAMLMRDFFSRKR